MNTDLSPLRTLLPKRDPMGNKGTFGHLTAVAGSARYRGAAALAVGAALRSGVGVVRLASVEPVIAAVAASRPECTFLPLSIVPHGGIDAEDFFRHYGAITQTDALLVGCGMTPARDTERIVAALLGEEIPLVIDADGLNVLSRMTERLKETKTTPILTPHIGEMARLTGLSIPHIKEHRREVASRFAAEYGCVVVLKDAVTVIAAPDGKSEVCDRPNSGLAKGGSGDVLAGIIASFLARGLAPYEAAVVGMLLHSLAAQKTARALTEDAMLPSDIITHLPLAFADLRKE